MNIRYEPILGAVVAVGKKPIAPPAPIKTARIERILNSAATDFVKDKTRRTGIRAAKTKLNLDLIIMIRSLYDRGVRICDIANELQMSPQHVGAIARRAIWRHV